MLTTFVFGFMLAGYRRFRPGIYENIYRDDVIFSDLYTFALAILMVNCTFWSKRSRWLLLAWAAILTSQYAMVRTGLLVINLFV